LDCRQLVTACRAKGLKRTTVRGIARTLSTILSQAVEDELLPGNPGLRLGRYLRSADDPEPEIDPLARDEVAALLEVARHHMPDWYPWLLAGLRTGMRAGELLALQWGDLDWRGSYLQVRRNLVRGQLTTPKNHQRRRVDMSRQLRAELRLWRRRQRAVWFKHGQPFPEWVFPSVTGTALDESNVRKAFNRLLDAADLHRRGPHQMRHSFASLLLQDGAPITYVSRQLGHKDPSITLRVYAHWVPDASRTRAVDLLDDAQPSATQAQPRRQQREWKNALSPYGRMVSQEGIEPSTRRLRGSRESEPITADLGKTGSAVFLRCGLWLTEAAFPGIRCTTLHTSNAALGRLFGSWTTPSGSCRSVSAGSRTWGLRAYLKELCSIDLSDPSHNNRYL
jgi:integrase